MQQKIGQFQEGKLMEYNLKTTLFAITASMTLSFSGVSWAAGAPSASGQSAASSAAISNPSNGTAVIQKRGDHESSFWYAKHFNEVATLPAFTINAPTGMVPSWGVVYGSLGGISNGPYSNDVDGGSAIGFGFGDAQQNIGGSLNLGLGSVGFDGGFMERGHFSVSLGHFFTSSLTGVSIGFQNINGWHGGNGLHTRTVRSSITQVWSNNYLPTVFTVGVGNGQFSFDDGTSGDDNRDKFGAFGSIGVYVLPQVSLIADYTSGVISAGTSITPIASLPLTVNLSAYDLNDHQPNDVAFEGSIAYAYVFD